jgi:pathogenesis-related protein 1
MRYRLAIFAFGAIVLGGCGNSGGTGTVAPGSNSLSNMLDLQNAQRAQVSVPPMQWSNDLAKQAQNWASQCNFSHSANPGSGENLYVDSNVNESAPTAGPYAVAAWAAEKSDYDISDNSCSGVCGHYTQMIWKTTTSVGCAVVNCSSNVQNFSSSGTMVVCEYSPPGNVLGQTPY